MASFLAVAIPAPVSTPASAASACSFAPSHPVLRGLPPCRALRASARPRSRGVDVACRAQGDHDIAIQVPDVTKSTWHSLVVESELPVLVEFWASWCGPCRMIDPVIGKLSKEYEGKLKFYKLDTDENPDIATQFGIKSIPTMVILKEGKKKDAVIGAVPDSILVTCIEKHVEKM